MRFISLVTRLLLKETSFSFVLENHWQNRTKIRNAECMSVSRPHHFRQVNDLHKFPSSNLAFKADLYLPFRSHFDNWTIDFLEIIYALRKMKQGNYLVLVERNYPIDRHFFNSAILRNFNLDLLSTYFGFTSLHQGNTSGQVPVNETPKKMTCYNTTVCILAGNDINFAIAACLSRLHIPR